MRSFEFALISAAEFTEFANKAPYGNFQQTASAAKLREHEGAQVAFIATVKPSQSVSSCTVEKP